MMNSERIMTLHPAAKKGVNIERQKYEQIKSFILKTLEDRGEISYQELNDLAVKELTKGFDGKVTWYVVTVKLDLEARNLIKRISGKGPHKLKLAKMHPIS